MSSWFRSESDGHERTMLALQAARVATPPDLAATDLRYYQNLILIGKRSRMPSRSQLMARWSWTDRRVRDLLADESRWADESKADAWAKAKGPAEVQRRSSGGPAEVQVDHADTVTMDVKGPNEVQRRSSGGPAEVHRRVVGTGTEQEQEQLPAPPARRPSKASGEGKARAPRKTADTAWAQQLADRWARAWGPEKYRFDWFKDRQSLARSIAALGVELNQPIPADALEHLERAMSAYIAAARRDDPKCFPKGTPTIGRFVIGLSDWLHSTEQTVVAHDVPRGTIEARVRRRLAEPGVTIPQVRDELAVSTKMKPPEVAYALTFLDRLEAR